MFVGNGSVVKDNMTRPVSINSKLMRNLIPALLISTYQKLFTFADAVLVYAMFRKPLRCVMQDSLPYPDLELLTFSRYPSKAEGILADYFSPETSRYLILVEVR